MILGGGSNLLFTRDYEGLIIHPLITGIQPDKTIDNVVVVTVGAGVVWDDFVAWAVSNGLGGTENLSLIPGMTGASAVQNIGAYGAEASEIIEAVHTISIESGKREIFTTQECNFGYRQSIFKTDIKGRNLITKISFRLTRDPKPNLLYGNLKTEVEKRGKPSLATTREAVIEIRRSKLPDPAETGNAGSFFKNPVVPESMALKLQQYSPLMPFYPAGEGLIKLAAGWLIEQCGWKSYRQGDAGVHDKQALVLVNHGNATGKEIFKLSEEIRASVNSRFGVSLEREVEVI
jgi:UDP-N-acetylmuramate dehydrogenase